MIGKGLIWKLDIATTSGMLVSLLNLAASFVLLWWRASASPPLPMCYRRG